MDNAIPQKIKDALGKSESIGIIVAPEPNIDIMAAGLSLYLLLKQANKKVSIACPTEPIVELSSIVGIDKVQPGLGGEAGDLVVSFPYVDGEIDKVSYTVEDGFLNIIVKAGEKGISFDDQDIRYSKDSGPIDLLFVIGAPRLDEIRDIFDTEKLRETRIINIDNKQENQGFGDIVIVSPQSSSVSEQVADLALALDMQVDRDVAQNLLSGITTVTKNFQHPATTPLAFEMASFLMKKGANRGRGPGGKREESPSQPDLLDRNERPQHDQQPKQKQHFNPRRDRDQRRSNQDRRDRPRYENRPQQDRPLPEEQQKQKLQNQLHEEQSVHQDAVSSTQQKPNPSWLEPKVYNSSSKFEE